MYEKPFHREDISQSTFLVTGGAGFIGSHIVEYLINQKAGKVIVIDDLSTGFKGNLEPYQEASNFEFHQRNINDTDFLKDAMSEVDYVLHQAALGSVPRSINDPLPTHASNATGFLSILEAIRASNVRRVVFASSSSVYGDSPYLPKHEEKIGNPKSPYAITKLMDEFYAELYHRIHDTPIVGLRYFNIFGPRQNPKGPYAAAIPLFILESMNERKPVVFGDGEQSRDFTFIENAVQANIKALFAPREANGRVFNIACGERYTLNEVLKLIEGASGKALDVQYKDERPGDIRDSHASIDRAKDVLAYEVMVRLEEGIDRTWKWYSGNRDYFQKSS